MARRCVLSGKGVMAGNNVSHAHNKTRRRYLPNVQSRRLFSETLAQSVNVRIATSTLRTIEKRGGLDAFLVGSPAAKLPSELVRLKRRIETRRSNPA